MASRLVMMLLKPAGGQRLLGNIGQDVPGFCRGFKRIRKVESDIKPPVDQLVAQHIGPGAGKKIWKAAIFTTTFGGAAFLGATIFEYERIRSQTFKNLHLNPFHKQFKKSHIGWRAQVKDWWDNLTEGQRTFYFICFTNSLVFLSWRIPQFRPAMMKYFTSNPANNITCLPMLLSTFSHYSLWHLAANMYVLHSFSTPAVSYLGREHFVALYLTSGVMSSMFSIAFKIFRNQPGASLGASGAIMGILAFVCTQYPDTKLSIILLPQVTFSAGAAIKSLMAFDTAGCIMGWKFFDHAAHLGGAFFGIFWHQWGIEHIWRKRAPVLTFWHDLRNGTKSN